MIAKRKRWERIFKPAGNTLFFGLLLLLVLSPDAKARFLKQLISVGLFKADRKKADTGKTVATHFTLLDENGNGNSTESLHYPMIHVFLGQLDLKYL